MTQVPIEDIEVNDVLILREANDAKTIWKEEVTAIRNPAIEDPYFQIKTKKLGFDFRNFFDIIGIEKNA